jgi:hypothetical protein
MVLPDDTIAPRLQPAPPAYRPGKVFCIGWHKTGTRSSGQALQRLGYRLAGWRTPASAELTYRWHEGNFEPIIRDARQFEALKDWPWPLVYRQMDQAFPDARFILTTRISDDVWLRSLQNHVAGRRPWVGRFLIYGSYDPVGDAARHVARYREHNQSVRDYFAGRPGKLLELCLENGDGWPALCAFLGIRDIPSEPFPHANKSRR